MPTFNVTEVSGSRLMDSTLAVCESRAQAVSLRTFVPLDEVEFVDGGSCSAAPGKYVGRYGTPSGRQFLVWEADPEPMTRGPAVPLKVC